MTMKIFTIGHSNRSFDEFCNLLKHYGIKLLIDVRRFPTSRKYPHFNRESLEKSLVEQCGIGYLYLGDELGGYRKGGYEAYMETDEFKEGLGKLLFWAQDGVTAIMCSEKLWFKCHRRFIADKLVELGHEVIHIIDERHTYKHKLREKLL
ncbi:MAG: DUF488 domain-containing protein [Candidatus Hydrothermota bacterium]|nr:MAG: DUF488 domain-containing protein [Candidatus Hydrothermae bacterium]